MAAIPRAIISRACRGRPRDSSSARSNEGTMSMTQRAELERIAMLYIDGLLAADDSKVPLSPDVKRAHLMVLSAGPHVWQMAEGADVIRRDIRRERLTARKDMKIMVDTEKSTVVIL